MKKILALLFFAVTTILNAQTATPPSGYTPFIGLREYAQHAIPSSDSLNQNLRDIDSFVNRADSIRYKTINGKVLNTNPVLLAEDIVGLDASLLDPRDYPLNSVLKTRVVSGDTVFVGANDSIANTILNFSRDTAYFYFRAHLSQNNTIRSGQVFVGYATYTPDIDTNVRSYSPTAYQTTFADNINISTSASLRLDTGVYTIQFRTGGLNVFRSPQFSGVGKNTRFETAVYTVFGSKKFTWDPDNEVYLLGKTPGPVGYLVIDMPHEEFYYEDGQLLLRTFDMNWNPADNILDNGITIEYKAYKEIYGGD